jgi:hypothetical protein
MPALLLVLLIVAFGAQAPRDGRPPASPASGTASISGRITDKESGQPMAGAVVRLRVEGAPETVGIADADGRYEFTGLAPGNYILWAGPPEGRATHLSQMAGETAPGFVVRGSTIKLEAAQRRTGEDLALCRSLAIEGRVVSALDEPLADVEVQVVRLDGARPQASAHTDDRGDYRVFGLEPGRYRVRARPNHHDVDVATNDEPRPLVTWHPSSPGEDGAGEVVVTARDVSGVDIRFQEARTHVLTGTVTNAAGEPVDGGHVSAVAPGRMASSAHVTAGRFTLRGLIPGRYEIAASAYLPHMVPPGSPPREAERAFADVDVAGDFSGLQLRLARPRTVEGRVVFAGNDPPRHEGSLVIQAHPEPGLLAWEAEILRGAPVILRGETGADMRFHLAEVFPRPRSVIATQPPTGWVVQHVHFGGRDITDRYVDLTPGEAADQLEVMLTNRIGKVKIRALENGGKAVKAFRVLLLPRDSGRWSAAFWRCLRLEPTRDGVADLRLLPGEYFVVALEVAIEMSLAWNEPPDLSRIASRAVLINVTTGTTLTVDVPLINPWGGER